MKRLQIAGAVVLVLTTIVLLFSTSRLPRREFELPDGSALRVEKVSFGKQESFKPPQDSFEKLKAFAKAHLPKALAVRIRNPAKRGTQNWNYVATNHPMADALNIWVTRRKAVTGDFDAVNAQHAELVDEHGCVLWMTIGGGEM